ISHSMGLFYETGAFFAGVVMARHPVSRFISESLKPLRDFFLVLFFFTLGAKLDLFLVKDLLFPAGLLALIFILFKPLVFKWMFMFLGETKDFSTEAGIRLGQLSEFSLLVALLALELGHISSTTAQFIQLVTIFTFIASSYIVVFKYPTPIGVSEKLIRT
ncbi:MAG: cation:proton antiporter, partial [Candidatus Omnitrophica bacterium]|nr:cation:proton antiporter [Candidatus Omnitrophota bacterium]